MENLKFICTAESLCKDLVDVDKQSRIACISTGFASLDNELGKGLKIGSLCMLGAIPSLGKTTLALNIADNVAKSGRDVLFVSLEMSRTELELKSLSRQSFLLSKPEAVNASSLINDYGGAERTLAQIAVWQRSIKAYTDNVAPRIYIAEGRGIVKVDVVKTAVQQFLIERKPILKPLVILDYLQILVPYNHKMTDKQAVDANVLELKKLARDSNVAVLAVSSLNRENYYSEIGFESFKESGGIDYSSDVVLGLQLSIDYESAKEKGDKRKLHDEAKASIPREVELKVIKNRMYKSGGKVLFDYYPQYDCFEEKYK